MLNVMIAVDGLNSEFLNFASKFMHTDSSTPSSVPTSNQIDHKSDSHRWRPQISLGTLLCIVAFVCVVISHFILSLKHHKQSGEYEKMKEDYAIIKVRDPNLLHASQLSANAIPGAHQFRLYLPPGKEYVLFYAIESIPKTGFVNEQGTSLNYGKVELPNSLFNGQSDNVVGVQVQDHRAYVWTPNTTTTLPLDRQSRTGKMHVTTSEGIAGRDGTVVAEPGKPLLLLRHREHFKDKGSVSSDDMPEFTPGVLLWIEEVTSAPQNSPIKVPMKDAAVK